MPRKRLSMRNRREILRLEHFHDCSIREISSSYGLGRSTVCDYLHRARSIRGQATIKKRQKDAEQKNAPDWLTRPIFGCKSGIVSRSTIPVSLWPAGDLSRYAIQIF